MIKNLKSFGSEFVGRSHQASPDRRGYVRFPYHENSPTRQDLTDQRVDVPQRIGQRKCVPFCYIIFLLTKWNTITGGNRNNVDDITTDRIAAAAADRAAEAEAARAQPVVDSNVQPLAANTVFAWLREKMTPAVRDAVLRELGGVELL